MADIDKPDGGRLPASASGAAPVHRGQRLRLAVGTSAISKVLGAVSQIITLPILLTTLGAERFAAYLALTALVAWVAPMGLGILPALTRQLASAAVSEDRAMEARLFGAGFWFTGLLATAILAGSLWVALSFDVRRMIGPFEGIAQSELQLGFAIAMGLTATFFFGNMSAAVRTGYQEFHFSNALSIIANLVTIIAVVALAGSGAGIGLFVVAVYAPLTIVMVLDIGRIVVGRPWLWPPAFPAEKGMLKGDLAPLFRTSGVTWISQLYGFLAFHGSILLVSNQFSAGDTASFGSVVRATLLGHAVIGFYVYPLVPAVTDAFVRGDRQWAMMSWRRSMLVTLALVGPASVVFMIAGPSIMQLWLGAEIIVPPLMAIGFGLFFLGFNFNFVGFNFCLSLGATHGLGFTYLVEAALFATLAHVLAPIHGASGIALALGIASVAVNFWVLPIRAWKRLGEVGIPSERGKT